MFVLPFSVLALWRRRPWGSGGRFLLGLAVLYAAVLLRLFLTAGYISQRHVLTLAAVAVVWAAAAPVFLGRPWLVAVLCLALAVQTCLPLPLRGDKAYRRDFARSLAPALARGEEVATLQGPEIPYYAGHPGVDWSANPGWYMDHIRPGQVMVLERQPDADWVAHALASPALSPVPSPDPRFAVFRRALP